MSRFRAVNWLGYTTTHAKAVREIISMTEQYSKTTEASLEGELNYDVH